MLFELKIAIVKSGRAQYRISQALGWHPSKISTIISEKYIPDSLEKELLAEELGVTVEKLFPPRRKGVTV